MMIELCASMALAVAKPNILFVLTDDQAVMLGGMEPLTKLASLVTAQGANFSNAFVHTRESCRTALQ